MNKYNLNILISETIQSLINEKKLCKKGKAYYNRRIAAGEKPSAYLSGRAVKVCKGLMEDDLNESLYDWFEKEDWVRIDTQGNITGPCGTMKKGKATTRCLPRAKANNLTKAERAATSRKKVAGSKKGDQFVPNTKKAKVKSNKQNISELIQLIRKTIKEVFFINESNIDIIKCKKCKWRWKLSDGGSDPYICHKCGYDNTLIEENKITEIKYVKPNFSNEWEEALRYPEFEYMGKEEWLKIASQGKPESFSKIKNILSNVDLDFDTLDEPKKERFKQAFEKGIIEMSIAVKFGDKDYDLVAGNTRLSGLVKNKIDPKIWIIDISKLIYESKVSQPDNIDEYDVENEQDLKEFISFLKEYTQQLFESEINEAKYQGRTVPLGKPMQGDIKKFKVYVKNPKTGKVVKVNFGAKGMNIKKNNPVRRKAFRARHNCDNPGPRTKARYWSCRKW
jgi:hypothetical protein